MKNNRIKIKRFQDNGMEIIHKKLKIGKKTSQLNYTNYAQNLSYKESDSSISNSIYKESNYSQYIINNKNEEVIKTRNKNIKLNKIPNKNKNLDENSNESYLNELSVNNQYFKDLKKNKILMFPRSKTINEIFNNQKNTSMECDSNRIYVHKKLKYLKLLNSDIKKNIQTTKNNTKKEINYEDGICDDYKNKDIYNKLVVFSNKNKYFKKKQLSEIENISNGISRKIKNIKSLDTSFKSKKESFFNFSKNNSKNKSLNSEEVSFSQNDEPIIKNKLPYEIDNGYDYSFDYININNINNNTNNKNDIINDDNEHKLYEEESNTSFEEDKIFIKNKNNNKNENIFINTNKINNVKNGGEKSEDIGDTININKNIIINKKIILVPKEKNKNKNIWVKTSYNFFNTSENKNNNSINNMNNNKNPIFKKNEDKLLHLKTKTPTNNFIYKKKSFASRNQKPSSRGISINTINISNNSDIKNITKKDKKLSDNNITEINKMSNTEQKFYEPKTNNKYYKDYILNHTFKKNLTERTSITNFSSNSKKLCLEKRNLHKDIFNKINKWNIEINKEKLNEQKTILNIEDKATDLSILENIKCLEIQLKLILNKIGKYQNCEKECYEFIHFYFEHNFYDDKIKLFYNIKNKLIIENNTKMEIIFLFICYEILSGKKFIKASIILKSIFFLLYDNFILLLVLIIDNNNSENNEIINNLIVILNEYIENNKKYDIIHMDENKIKEIIENNTKEITNYYQMLIDSLYKKDYIEKDYSIKFPYCIKNINIEIDSTKIKNVISSFFFETYKTVNNYNFNEFKYFFYLFLYHKNEKIEKKHKLSRTKKSKINKSKEKNITKYTILSPIKNNYKYTLILDLDETLIYLQNKDLNKKLTLRPNVHEFLHEMKSIYELILFSENSINYIAPILDIIQQNEIYFEYILCNEFITFDKDGQEIKDLNLLGRDLKNIIIVDNMKQYYRNTDNLICIKSFFGDVNNDKKTLKLLGNVLKEIKFDAEKTCDIRISINKFKYKLYPKVINSLD